jgi:hypothetical protein
MPVQGGEPGWIWGSVHEGIADGAGDGGPEAGREYKCGWDEDTANGSKHSAVSNKRAVEMIEEAKREEEQGKRRAGETA